MKNILIIKNFKKPTVAGNYHRLQCMTGEDRGVSYYLSGKRAVLGRGDDVDIVVLDSKISRKHAEIIDVSGACMITDLDSQNGVLVNEKKIKQVTLRDDDKIILGKTVYKYNKIEVKGILETIDDVVKKEEVKKQLKKEETQKKNPDKKRVMIILGVAILAAFFMFSGDNNNPVRQNKKKRTTIAADDFTKMLKKKIDKDGRDVRDKVAIHIHRGQREFREGNYFRAIKDFNMALLLSPKHGQASFYLNKAKQSLDDEIREYFLRARRQIESLKYQEATQSYCAVKRRLKDYKNDKRYLQANSEITLLEEKMGLDEGTITCGLDTI